MPDEYEGLYEGNPAQDRTRHWKSNPERLVGADRMSPAGVRYPNTGAGNKDTAPCEGVHKDPKTEEWHMLECDFTCGAIMGCASQWQAEEIAKMVAPSLKSFAPNVILEPKAKQPPLRPRTSAERKAEPMHRGCLMYFPDALAAVSRLSLKANKKHNPGEPLGWTRGKSADHDDCIVRHSLTLEDTDPDTGEIEAVNRAWRALATLQLLEEKRLTAAGILPYSKVTS